MKTKIMKSVVGIGLVVVLFTVNLVPFGSGVLFLTDLLVAITLVQVVLFERRE